MYRITQLFPAERELVERRSEIVAPGRGPVISDLVPEHLRQSPDLQPDRLCERIAKMTSI